MQMLGAAYIRHGLLFLTMRFATNMLGTQHRRDTLTFYAAKLLKLNRITNAGTNPFVCCSSFNVILTRTLTFKCFNNPDIGLAFFVWNKIFITEYFAKPAEDLRHQFLKQKRWAGNEGLTIISVEYGH